MLFRSQNGSAPAVTNDQFPLAGPTITWRFAPTTRSDVPTTVVYVTIDGTEYSVGEYTGSCSDTSLNSRLSGELSASLCWYAGGGSEIGVFEEGTALVIKVGQVDEASAETPGFRGNFKTVLRIGN